jgi:cell division protein FtsW
VLRDTVQVATVIPPPVLPATAVGSRVLRALAPLAIDHWLLGAVLFLVGFGVVMSYSASAVFAGDKLGSAEYFLIRHGSYAVLGVLAMAAGLRIDYRRYRRFAYPILGVALLALVAVLLFGARVSGARRWFRLGMLSVQPSDPAKLALVLYLAHSAAKKAEKIKSLTVGFLPHLCVVGLMAALVLRQPDLGTAAILGAVGMLTLFVSGAKVTYLGMAALVAAPVAYQAIVGTPWRLKRILAFLDPWAFRHDVGYQVFESLLSIGSGGVLGSGLGDGKQKLFFLPEAHTDFILAIIGEETGLLGMAAVLCAFVLLSWRGLRIAARASDPFGCYLAFGITATLALSALVNMGVVLGLLPTKGLALPFVSFGGSALVTAMFSAGVLLNISMRQPAASAASPPGMAAMGVRRLWRRVRGNRRLPGAGERVEFVVEGSGAAAAMAMASDRREIDEGGADA